MAVKEEIINPPPIWWDLTNIPTTIVKELRRRNNVNNIGMSIPQPLTYATYNFENSYESYKGPMTPWVRVFSNGKGLTVNQMVPLSSYLYKNSNPIDYNGFILKGGDGFYDAFGYDQKTGLQQSKAIIGYDADDNPHYIDPIYRTQLNYSSPSDVRFPQNNQVPSIVPPPGVKSVTIKQNKDFMGDVSVSFKCYGLAQLEYLIPFFLTPGINIFIEFGWNLFNQKSLLDLKNIPECWEIIEKPQTVFDRADKSNGNYGCLSGLITNYKFNTTDGFVYECVMDIKSRQYFYSGMRTDNNVKIFNPLGKNSIGTENPGQGFDPEFVDLKTFFTLYLPLINEVLEQPPTLKAPNKFSSGLINTKANFLNYIVDKMDFVPDTKKEKEASANAQQQSQGSNVNNIKVNLDNKNKKTNSTLFYRGRPEDRAFIGRLEKVYHKKNTIAPGPIINYEESSFKTNTLRGELKSTTKFNQYSFLDNKTDFDAGEGATEVWMQLDFVFELANIFMSNTKTKQFSVDISNVIINAHPNLISCDKHVLIPNPAAPKINKPATFGGYVKGKDSLKENNVFITQQEDYNVPENLILESKYNLAKNMGLLSEFYETLFPEESLYFACEAARKTFRTEGRTRDNLDVIINYLYYNSVNANKKRSAAFPFAEDMMGEDNTVKYKGFYYGYLKHLYISKTKLIDIVKSDDVKNYKQFINAVLNTINSAVENFWKFDIVEGADEEGKSTLSIVDKNIANFDVLDEIYTFELGGSNNVIKSIDFNVSLTNEQAINVLYGAQNTAIKNFPTTNNTANNNLTNNNLNMGGINSSGAGLEYNLNSQSTGPNTSDGNPVRTNNVNLPFIKYIDRMDEYQASLLAKQTDDSLPAISTVPGATGVINDSNSAIESLQKYGPQLNTNSVLCVCVKQVPADLQTDVDKITESATTNENDSEELAKAEATVSESSIQLNDAPNNYKYLCLPPGMKGKLVQMLDDGDFKNNVAKYGGVADNFNIKIKFDGIFSFRNLQCFAISNLPKPYVPGNVIYQIIEVDHEISGGKWETVVTALVRVVPKTLIRYVPV